MMDSFTGRRIVTSLVGVVLSGVLIYGASNLEPNASEIDVDADITYTVAEEYSDFESYLLGDINDRGYVVEANLNKHTVKKLDESDPLYRENETEYGVTNINYSDVDVVDGAVEYDFNGKSWWKSSERTLADYVQMSLNQDDAPSSFYTAQLTYDVDDSSDFGGIVELYPAEDARINDDGEFYVLDIFTRYSTYQTRAITIGDVDYVELTVLNNN